MVLMWQVIMNGIIYDNIAVARLIIFKDLLLWTQSIVAPELLMTSDL